MTEDEQFEHLLRLDTSPGVRFAYGGYQDQFFEVFSNGSNIQHVIILVHGGYFRNKYTLLHMRPMARALAQQANVVVLLMEYRRTGAGGGHPYTLADVTQAMTYIQSCWMPAHDARDAKLTVSGHSAGGCLAMAWASHLGDQDEVICLRLLAPISDLVKEATMGPSQMAIVEYMQGSPRSNWWAFQHEDPYPRRAYMPKKVSLSIMHGDADGSVHISFSRDLGVKLQELPGANHFDLVDPCSGYFEYVTHFINH